MCLFVIGICYFIKVRNSYLKQMARIVVRGCIFILHNPDIRVTKDIRPSFLGKWTPEISNGYALIHLRYISYVNKSNDSSLTKNVVVNLAKALSLCVMSYSCFI